MSIDFVDVENFAHQYGVPKKFYINKINKHLNLDNHFGIIKIKIIIILLILG